MPWIGMLTVTRSAADRTWPLRLVSSGTSRRRPNIVLTTPVSRAVAIVWSMNPRTRGKPAKYASMNACAACCVTPMSFASVKAVFP